MKKIITYIVSLLMLFISGCKSNDIYMYPTDTPPPDLKSIDEIIDTHGDIKNIERFTAFIHNIQQAQNDQIRVVKYTVEGDPIIYEYVFKDGLINVMIDTTQDGYGPQEIIFKTCTAISVHENEEHTSYVLEDCMPSVGDVTVLVVYKQSE